MFSPNSKPPKLSDNLARDAARQKKRQPMTPAAKRRMWGSVALTVVLLVVWFGAHAFGEELHLPMISYVVMAVYFVAFAALLIGYLIYNRAFVNKDVTEEMLPDTWSPEKKRAFVEDNRRRAERSRWMMTLILPFAIVFLMDAFYLFVWNGFLSDLFK